MGVAEPILLPTPDLYTPGLVHCPQGTSGTFSALFLALGRLITQRGGKCRYIAVGVGVPVYAWMCVWVVCLCVSASVHLHILCMYTFVFLFGYTFQIYAISISLK